MGFRFVLLASLLFVSAVAPTSEQPLRPSEPYKASEHVEDIIKIVDAFADDARMADALDLFSGKGNFVKQAIQRGLGAKAFDKVTVDESHDILTEAGFIQALMLVLSVVPWGMVLLGPPCSLFVWMSSNVHRRSAANPDGDTTNRLVREANIIVENCVILMCVAIERSLFVCLEQPLTSMMPLLTCLKLLIRFALRRVCTWMGAYGHKLPKPTVLFGNFSSLSDLRKKWTKKERERHNKKWPKADRKAYNCRGGSVYGHKKNLKDSAAYTPTFARAVLNAQRNADKVSVKHGSLRGLLQQVGML